MPVGPIASRERTTMRVLVFRSEVLDGGASSICEVARVDVTLQPAMGSGMGKLMSARHGGEGYSARQFAGQRLENCVWNPSPPDILVSVDPGTPVALPDGIRRGLPWIVVLAAWRRLHPMLPPTRLEACWEEVDDGFVPKPAPSRSEREAWFGAMALRRLLDHASPDELIAMSMASLV